MREFSINRYAKEWKPSGTGACAACGGADAYATGRASKKVAAIERHTRILGRKRLPDAADCPPHLGAQGADARAVPQRQTDTKNLGHRYADALSGTAAADTALGNKPHDQHRLAGHLRKSGLPLRLKIKPQP